MLLWLTQLGRIPFYDDQYLPILFYLIRGILLLISTTSQLQPLFRSYLRISKVFHCRLVNATIQ